MQADRIFTSLALLAMVTHPANMVMTLIPQAVSVMANFDRVQVYISQEGIHDPRELSVEHSAAQVASTQSMTVEPPSLTYPILCDVNLAINRGEIVICAGAVGSGKTTLAMALLGEATLTMGSIRVSSKEIAYCAQGPWLPSVTIREAISGKPAGKNVDIDTEWYSTVVEACGLVPDFNSFVAGDMALIENSGMNLSGGQKQRIVRSLLSGFYSEPFC
jgi:ABC-type protease/lipase transport system fused ATPase/permease subunit